VHCATDDGLCRVAAQKGGVDVEAADEVGAAGWDVPVAGDLGRVLFVEDRTERGRLIVCADA
jgi:hypothetical protein